MTASIFFNLGRDPRWLSYRSIFPRWRPTIHSQTKTESSLKIEISMVSSADRCLDCNCFFMARSPNFTSRYLNLVPNFAPPILELKQIACIRDRAVICYLFVADLCCFQLESSERTWGCGGMVDATDLKSVVRNGRASSSLATPISNISTRLFSAVVRVTEEQK